MDCDGALCWWFNARYISWFVEEFFFLEEIKSVIFD
jgi:hypothetical protein